MNYRNFAKIKYIEDPNEYEAYFNNYYENEWYLIIDKQLLGEELGREIIDNTNEKDILNEKDGDISIEFEKENLNKIKKEITDEIAKEINNFVMDYIGNNL